MAEFGGEIAAPSPIELKAPISKNTGGTIRETASSETNSDSNLAVKIAKETEQKMPIVNPNEEKMSESLDTQMASMMKIVKNDIPNEVLEADDEKLRLEQKKLKELPYFSGVDLRDLLDYKGEDEGFSFVKTKAIVGSVSPAFENWSTEYESRKDRMISIAKNLRNSKDINGVFHIYNQDEQIKLKKISGPAGDLFFAVDGSHRIGASKLCRLSEIPAQVDNVSNISEVDTTEKDLASQWQERIKKGLIKGNIEDVKHNDSIISYKLNIEDQILPWMHLPQNKLIKFNKFYQSQYPNAFDELEIPKRALLDEVGFNYYLAGRYDEYEGKKEIGSNTSPKLIKDTEGYDVNSTTGKLVFDGHEYANIPRIRGLIKRAKIIKENLPSVQNDCVRLWRGNRPGEVGYNPSFTSSLVGIALPFLDSYGNGDISYVDIPKADLNKYLTSGAPGLEFMIPADLAKNAQIANDSLSPKKSIENKTLR